MLNLLDIPLSPGPNQDTVPRHHVARLVKEMAFTVVTDGSLLSVYDAAVVGDRRICNNMMGRGP
jgi:hypothetical protein